MIHLITCTNAGFLSVIGGFVHRLNSHREGCRSRRVSHYSPLGGILFDNETMDVSLRQTLHKVKGSYI